MSKIEIDWQKIVANTPKTLYIDGQQVEAEERAKFEVIDPGTGEVIASVANASVADAKKAVDAAVRAQKQWGKTTPMERSRILRRIYELVVEHKEELAVLTTVEMGKTLPDARAEVDSGAAFLLWFSELATHHHGTITPGPMGNRDVVAVSRPIGPCALFVPWNFPFFMSARKIAPALAAGCTFVLRPANKTPLTSLAFIKLLAQAGVPAGVANLITSKSATAVSKEIMTDGRIRKVSFTGSTQVGKLLLKQAADYVINSSMELGGNAPFIVFEKSDLDLAAEHAILAKFRGKGEVCVAGNRYFVHESVIDEFTDKVVKKVEAIKVGHGLEDGVYLGALSDESRLDAMDYFVELAKKQGGEVLTGGHRLDRKGSYYAPTVIKGAEHSGEIVNHEIFGPIISIYPFKTEEEVIEKSNSTIFGLAAYVFTKCYNHFNQVAAELEFGMVGWNCGLISDTAAPFGGMKQSGLGREGGHEALAEFTETQYLALPKP